VAHSAVERATGYGERKCSFIIGHHLFIGRIRVVLNPDWNYEILGMFRILNTLRRLHP
jgi:hypothetical protein